MKRYIRSDKSYSVKEQVGPGLAYTPDGKGYFGEKEHKSYRGVPIRDFRNGWIGLPDFEESKHLMDVLLDAYDLIEDEYSDVELRFFNLYDSGTVELHFYGGDDTFIGVDYNSISMELDGHCSVSVNYFGDYINSNFDPKRIADCYIKLVEHRKDSIDRSKQRQISRENNLKKQFNEETRPNDFSYAELTVPVDVEVDTHSVSEEIPSDDIIINMIESSVNINDTNRFIKKIEVRFLYSGTYIYMFPRVRVKNLSVKGNGKTLQMQLERACSKLSSESAYYFKELQSRFGK